jgi:hypothetical protein
VGDVVFYWRYRTASGIPVDGPEETFEDQAEAEAWFADIWADLRAQGVDAVVLHEGEKEVYGPMSLDEE